MYKYSATTVLIGVLLTVLLVLPLRWFNPPTTAFILRDKAVSSAWIHQRWVPIEEISPLMQMAVIAAEDQRFPQHHGFDFDELKKALSQSSGPRRGASTITQQLAKNLYLWPGKSIFRKAIEANFALFMELFLSKQRILEIYLNVVEFGPGVYGVGQASQVFFNKTPGKLNRIDASLLAAVLPNPKKMDVAQPSPYMYERALDIRFFIRNLGGAAYLERLQRKF